MIFASLRQQTEFIDMRVPNLLREIVLDCATVALDKCKWNFRITSCFRTQEENADAGGKTLIHCLWRAIDVGAADVEQEWIDFITDYANTKWVYDPSRPKIPVCYSAPHGSGPHLHFQVCDQTRRR